ncbi:glycosyltransferase family 2 protein [Candidatus Parcubacteria bacterium]|jgi:N-acetylglucosaminyl-diphospho-decaprenol L-rhamnosyltransferase|nr:glycosyltransferase family 2 protein [Candidatus Parcubacteria bacterium]
MSSKPEVSVIIVNWKVRPLLEKCLDSIIANSEGVDIEIILVDNDSRDGTSEMVMAEYPQVRMIALPRNHGFAAANNLALKQARGKYLFLLNPDTRVTPEFFPKMLTYLKEHPDVGIVGPKILNFDRSLQLSVRRFPDLLSQILILLKLKNVMVDNKFLAHYLFGDFDYEKEQPVDQIMGAAMLIRREVLDEVGVFDQKFFIWFEEVDICKRAHKAGFVVQYYPGVQIIHYGGSSFSKQMILWKQIVFNKSLLYYFWKHKPIWQWFILLLFAPINLVLTLLYVIFLESKN